MPENKFVGTWKLLSFEVRIQDGTVMKLYGDNPTGMLIFDHKNNFVAQVMKPDRKNFESNNQYAGNPDEIKEAFEGYTAYFGTCEVKDDKTLVNKVEGSLYPNWIGSEQIRYYEFHDNYLDLRTFPTKMGEIEYTAVLKWERVV